MSSWALPKSFAVSLCGLLGSLGAVGCSSDKGSPAAEPSAAAATIPKPAPVAKPRDDGQARLSARSRLKGVRPLIVEARRAELEVGGLFIDFGTADQLKYTAGGWGNGWGERKADADGTTYAETRGRTLPVRMFLYRDTGQAKQVALRLRGRGGPRVVGVQLNGQAAGRARVGTAFTTVSVPLAAGMVVPGPMELTLDVDSATPGAAAGTGGVDIDWLWLGRSRDGAFPQTGPRVAPMTFGEGTRRALLAPTPRTYAFYFDVPPAASLVFDYGGEAGTRFVVRARVDRAYAPKVVFQAMAEPARWQEAVVDLSPLAGRTIKLELMTQGSISAGWGDPEIMVPREAVTAAPAPGSRKPARNVILLVMDTARADVYRPFNAKSTVRTPSFDRLSEESTVFTSAYANENWTKPSVATILSGLYPTTHGTKGDSDVLSSDVRLLSEHLQRKSFATAAFIANGYCSDKFGFKRGWDEYRNYIRENKPSEAEYVFGDALNWITKHTEERFFVYLQTIDPHVPYDPPAEYTRMYFPGDYRGRIGRSLDGLEQLAIASQKKPIDAEDWNYIKALYEAEVTYHDSHLGKFLEKLDEIGLLDETLLIVTNDHGEELRDHGKLGHGHSLYDELVRAPLMIRYPALFRGGQRVRDPVENVDLFPTVLEALGMEPVSDIDGVSLLPMLEGKPPAVPSYAISEFRGGFRSVRVGRWKMIAGLDGQRRLFDLEVDPGEQTDQVRRSFIAGRMCEQHLAEFLASPAKTSRYREANVQVRRFKPGFVKQDPELKKQLEALGYFGGNP
jgi:choline-sulfatase